MTGRYLNALGLVFALVLSGSPSTAPPLAAQTKALAIERFDAEINVLSSGVVEVTEAIRFRFTGSWNGVYRDIPILYETPQRFNYNLAIQIHSILDEAGQPLP